LPITSSPNEGCDMGKSSTCRRRLMLTGQRSAAVVHRPESEKTTGIENGGLSSLDFANEGVVFSSLVRVVRRSKPACSAQCRMSVRPIATASNDQTSV
jgi:hypothetical protein